jgi:hypothetical protein
MKDKKQKIETRHEKKDETRQGKSRHDDGNTRQDKKALGKKRLSRLRVGFW